MSLKAQLRTKTDEVNTSLGMGPRIASGSGTPPFGSDRLPFKRRRFRSEGDGLPSEGDRFTFEREGLPFGGEGSTSGGEGFPPLC